MTRVYNLRTGVSVYYMLDPQQAVVAAWRQMDKRDYNTWNYSKYDHLVRLCNQRTYNLGDWAAIKEAIK